MAKKLVRYKVGTQFKLNYTGTKYHHVIYELRKNLAGNYYLHNLSELGQWADSIYVPPSNVDGDYVDIPLGSTIWGSAVGVREGDPGFELINSVEARRALRGTIKINSVYRRITL